MITKAEAQYQVSSGSGQCGNCAMFSSGSCSLVLGLIEPYTICGYWEADPGDVTSVSQHLAMYGADSA